MKLQVSLFNDELNITNITNITSPDYTAEIALKSAIKGEDGEQGKSAYQVWLDNGNVGSEEDYLDWLREPATEAQI